MIRAEARQEENGMQEERVGAIKDDPTFDAHKTIEQQSHEVDVAIAGMLERKKQAAKITEFMAHFTGTEHWYKHMCGLLYTDGINYVAGSARAFWLIDIVASYQPKLKDYPFQLWEVEVCDNKGRVVCREDTTQNHWCSRNWNTPTSRWTNSHSTNQTA